MASTGIDRKTGKIIRDIEHVRQSFYTILWTRFGSRVMRRTVGSAVPPLFGRNIVPATFLRFAAALIIAIDLWEPRLKIKRVTFPGTKKRDDDAPARIRRGEVGLAVLAEYRPRGHLGDPTPEGPDRVLLF